MNLTVSPTRGRIETVIELAVVRQTCPAAVSVLRQNDRAGMGAGGQRAKWQEVDARVLTLLTLTLGPLVEGRAFQDVRFVR